MLIKYFSSFSVEVAWTRTIVGSMFKKKSLSGQVHLLSFAGPFQKLLENGIMDAEWGDACLKRRQKKSAFYLIESASPASLASFEARLPSAEILIEPAGKRLLACGRKQPEPFFTGVCGGNCNKGIDRITIGMKCSL